MSATIETFRNDFRNIRSSAKKLHGLDSLTFDRALEIAFAEITNDGEAFADNEPTAEENASYYVAAAVMVERNDFGLITTAREDVALFAARKARRDEKIAKLVALGLDEERAQALCR